MPITNMRWVFCSDSLGKDRKRLEVDLQDIRNFDEKLYDNIIVQPDKLIPLVRVCSKPAVLTWRLHISKSQFLCTAA